MLNIFFSIKLIRQFSGGKKNFQGGQTTENITEKHCFSKSRGAAAPPPPGLVCIRSWTEQHNKAEPAPRVGPAAPSLISTVVGQRWPPWNLAASSFSLFSAVWALCGAEPGASVVAPCFWCGLPAKPCSTFCWLLYMLLLPCWPDFGYLTYK
jgi:hypothetical protein